MDWKFVGKICGWNWLAANYHRDFCFWFSVHPTPKSDDHPGNRKWSCEARIHEVFTTSKKWCSHHWQGPFTWIPEIELGDWPIWIGWREHLQETMSFFNAAFPIKSVFSTFSLQPLRWFRMVKGGSWLVKGTVPDQRPLGAWFFYFVSSCAMGTIFWNITEHHQENQRIGKHLKIWRNDNVTHIF